MLRERTESLGWVGGVLGQAEAKPAPQPLTRVQALINTLDRESGIDLLSGPDDPGPWLVAQGILPAGRIPSTADLRSVRGFREGLRAMVVHNTGGPAPTARQMAPVTRIAETAAARAHVEADGTVRINPVGDSLAEGLLALLLIVADAQRSGTWAHLKACANEDCRWAFYDRSRNHGGTWCDMATCGNKLKNRTLRARRSARPIPG